MTVVCVVNVWRASASDTRKGSQLETDYPNQGWQSALHMRNPWVILTLDDLFRVHLP